MFNKTLSHLRRVLPQRYITSVVKDFNGLVGKLRRPEGWSNGGSVCLSLSDHADIRGVLMEDNMRRRVSVIVSLFGVSTLFPL